MISKKHLLLIVAVLAIASVAVACGGGGSSGGGGGNAKSVTVTMTDFKFDPAEIDVSPGQTVNLTVKNNGSTRHTWVSKDLNVNLGADPGQSASATFTAPSSATTLKVECDVPGHADQGMVGTVVVK